MRGDIISGLGAYRRAVTDYQSAMKLGAEVKEKATLREGNQPEKSDSGEGGELLEGVIFFTKSDFVFVVVVVAGGGGGGVSD